MPCDSLVEGRHYGSWHMDQVSTIPSIDDWCLEWHDQRGMKQLVELPRQLIPP